MAAFLFLPFFINQPLLVASAPTNSNATNPPDPIYQSWSPEPNTRGTSSIIFSCLTTLLFCSSKILKPNILPSHWTGRRIQLTQIIIGMFVPELVYLVALGQYFDARGIRDTINCEVEKIAKKPAAPAQSAKPAHSGRIVKFWRRFMFEQEPELIHLDLPNCTHFERWTLTQGFYAVMGGFQKDISPFSSSQPRPLRLRPHILIDLAQDHQFHILNIPASELTDKSKFDILGTTVAFVQALWFCAQAIARIQQHLAVSLLEVSTVAHVVMSVFTLTLWWQKPQSVSRGHTILHTPTPHSLETLARYEKNLMTASSLSLSTLSGLKRERYITALYLRQHPSLARYARNALHGSALREAQSSSPFLREAPDSLWMFHDDQPASLRERWFADSLYSLASAAFWSVVAVYGGVHVAAWKNHFPSLTERMIWRVASCLVASIPLTFGVGSLLLPWTGPERWERLLPSRNGGPVRYAHTLGYVVVISHLYLAVESWIGLRSLPVSAFQTVDWTAVFPHLA